MSVLTVLASHNEWANRRIFEACSEISPAKLKAPAGGYESVIGILEHLVQVEHSFLELAHGRQPRKIRSKELEELRAECARIDRAYIDYQLRSTKPMPRRGDFSSRGSDSISASWKECSNH